MTVPAWDKSQVGAAYVWRALADHLEARIRAGEWASGDKLPGERSLAGEYAVADGSIRRAFTELRQRGVIVTLAQKGSFVV